MLRTTLDKAYLKRTIRPLYGWTQATPKSAFLDPAWDRSTPIFPGQVMKHVSGDLYSLAVADADLPAGLSGLYIGGDDIDEVLESGVNALAVWVLGPDAEFEVLAPAFDEGDGTFVEGGLIHFHGTGADAAQLGKLCPADETHVSTAPVARLLKIVSPERLIIRGLAGTV
jgi:hypothetical protein